MRITVIHGSQRKGNTETALEIVKSKLNYLGTNEFIDFYLPKDMPDFCLGCYQCFDKGDYPGEYCPHSKYTHPILEAMKSSDGIIITSPVYCLAESGQVKTFLDHFGCIYIPHRPLPEMFAKTAFIISTTAGTGTKNAIKTIERTLNFWGIQKVHQCGLTMFAKDWKDMPVVKQAKYKNRLEDKATAFYASLCRKPRISMKTKFIFFAIKNMIKGYDDKNADKVYWRSKGWLQGGHPWSEGR